MMDFRSAILILLATINLMTISEAIMKPLLSEGIGIQILKQNADLNCRIRASIGDWIIIKYSTVSIDASRFRYNIREEKKTRIHFSKLAKDNIVELYAEGMCIGEKKTLVILLNKSLDPHLHIHTLLLFDIELLDVNFSNERLLYEMIFGNIDFDIEWSSQSINNSYNKFYDEEIWLKQFRIKRINGSIGIAQQTPINEDHSASMTNFVDDLKVAESLLAENDTEVLKTEYYKMPLILHNTDPNEEMIRNMHNEFW